MSPWSDIATAPKDRVIEARGRDLGDPMRKWHVAFVYYENNNWTDGETIYRYLSQWRPVNK